MLSSVFKSLSIGGIAEFVIDFSICTLFLFWSHEDFDNTNG